MIPVYVGGAGMTQFGKSAKTLVELLYEAAVRALSATKIDEVEAIYVAAMNPEEFTGEGNLASRITEALSMSGIPAIRVETASSAGAAAFSAGLHAVASGGYRRVLVVGGEKMTHVSTSAATRIVAEALDIQERRCGATLPALAAMVAEKYRSHYHLSDSRLERILCELAVKNHLNGSQNSYAQFHNAISREQYFSSRFIATPLRLYDCAPISDGAAAVVLTTEPTDVIVSGVGQATAPVSLRKRESLTSFAATRTAGRRAYAMAGCTPETVDFAEVHDAFTPFEIIASEDLGFFSAGKGGNAVEAGQTQIDGSLPINASGGLKARGHPIGASGVAQVCECVRLLRGQAGVKLKREPVRGLAQSTGALATNNFVTILERADLNAQVQSLWLQRTTGDRRPGMDAPHAAPSSDSQVSTALQSEAKNRKLETNKTTEDRRPRTAEQETGKTTEDRRPGTGSEKPETRNLKPETTRTTGKIETFTIVHTTAEGFLAPLVLALIRDRKGSLIMARGEDAADLKIGREVHLRERDGIYFFKVKSYLRQAREAMRHFLARATRNKGRSDGVMEQ